MYRALPLVLVCMLAPAWQRDPKYSHQRESLVRGLDTIYVMEYFQSVN